MNVNPEEVDKFDRMAPDWWDPAGPCRPLHDLNPVRLDFIVQRATISEQRILDVGCGGGILTESLCQLNGKVEGLDASQAAINTAKAHATSAGLSIPYHCEAVEAFAQQCTTPYDMITCMELLEHVPDPAAFLETLSTLLKPGGVLFVSTLNRTPEAFFKAIVGAEYLLRLLPAGTHRYRDFIKPSELAAWARRTGLSVKSISGLKYNPLTRQAGLTRRVGVNYLMQLEKD